ncbi:hypothetical protein ACNKHP_16975 [Shigella boydii]
MIGTATGKQSNWLSGQHGRRGRLDARRSKRSAESRRAMVNVIYGMSSPSQGMLSSFVPTDSQIIGQVPRVPELMRR